MNPQPKRVFSTGDQFINGVLTPGLARYRQIYPGGTGLNISTLPEIDRVTDELLDIKEQEILVTQRSNGFFPDHRVRVFSSVNNWRPPQRQAFSTAITRAEGPERKLQVLEDELMKQVKFVGLAQTEFVSSNSALEFQGLSIKVGGVATVLNEESQTWYAGDKLRIGVPLRINRKSTSGIPHEKVRFIFKKVKGDSAPLALQQQYDDLPDRKPALGAVLALIRKHSYTVVAEVKSYCRPGDHAEIKLTPPTTI